MERPFIKLTFYETYYFANAVKNVLEDQFSYIRHLDEFYGDRQFLGYIQPFPRYSAFHSFICFIIDDLLSADLTNIELERRQKYLEDFRTIPAALDPHPSKLPVNLALDRFGIPHDSFDTWLHARNNSFLKATDDDADSYYEDLRLEGPFEQLLERATAEVFFVLFQNRQALMLFNDMMSRQMNRADEDEFIPSESADHFVRPGILKRVSIPAWVRRAVYFRDRGLCVLCRNDLSGLLAIGAEENYDHIVPLAAGGLNDVTNIQLLCRECNARKRAGEPVTSSHYEAWYPEHDAGKC